MAISENAFTIIPLELLLDKSIKPQILKLVGLFEMMIYQSRQDITTNDFIELTGYHSTNVLRLIKKMRDHEVIKKYYSIEITRQKLYESSNISVEKIIAINDH